VTLAEGQEIRPGDLPTAVRLPRALPRHLEAPVEADSGVGPPAAGRDPRDAWSLAEVEKEHIRRVLALHRGNATTAARQLGISRTTLWRKLREYGLSRTAG